MRFAVGDDRCCLRGIDHARELVESLEQPTNAHCVLGEKESHRL
jgi:hypothetical protein